MEMSAMRDAIRPIEHDYNADIRGTAEEIIREYRAGNVDELSERIDEEADSSWWCTYTWPAQFVLVMSENADAWTELGPFPMRDEAPNWEAAACCAIRQDLADLINVLAPNLEDEADDLDDAEEDPEAD